MGAGGPEAVVLGERGAVAPREAVGGRRGVDGSGDVVPGDLDVDEDIARIAREVVVGPHSTRRREPSCGLLHYLTPVETQPSSVRTLQSAHTSGLAPLSATHGFILR